MNLAIGLHFAAYPTNTTVLSDNDPAGAEINGLNDKHNKLGEAYATQGHISIYAFKQDIFNPSVVANDDPNSCQN